MPPNSDFTLTGVYPMTLSLSAAYQDYFAATDRQTALAVQPIPLNKAALFHALKPHGIALVIADFDGAGDSGQIETITALNAAKAETSLPSVGLTLYMINQDASGQDTIEVALAEAIETLCYDFLEQTHSGWGNEDGAFGECCFDVEAGTITLDYNERRTEVDFSSHNF
ncbi:MAG: hypothetical protein NW215_07445 [Hyphomicrobiales bacterium]|nr:hypothetical protein [Hyphomicrobiales bacterium]